MIYSLIVIGLLILAAAAYVLYVCRVVADALTDFGAGDE